MTTFVDFAIPAREWSRQVCDVRNCREQVSGRFLVHMLKSGAVPPGRACTDQSAGQQLGQFLVGRDDELVPGT